MNRRTFTKQASAGTLAFIAAGNHSPAKTHLLTLSFDGFKNPFIKLQTFLRNLD